MDITNKICSLDFGIPELENLISIKRAEFQVNKGIICISMRKQADLSEHLF